MQRRIAVTEYRAVEEVTAGEAELVRTRLNELATELKPRLSFLVPGNDLIIRNLVGTVKVTSDLTLDIAPRVATDTQWTRALVDLMSPPTRVEFGGENKESERHHVRRLPDAFAELFLRQLDQALRREGPLTLIEFQATAPPSLAGRLDVTRWVSQRALKPAHFPQHQSVLTVDNPFTTLLAAVGELLAASTTNPGTAAALRGVAGRLRPGLAPHVALDPAAALRELPSQWRAYRPAWNTAVSVVRRLAPLKRHGSLEGFGVALEPWPLLETLLARALEAFSAVAARFGQVGLAGTGDVGSYPLRQPVGKRSPETRAFHVRGDVKPDGVLQSGEDVVATFEAKYTPPTPKGIRGHAFQALTTAAALSCPAAVLVYPTNFEAVAWTLTGFGGRPDRLIAVGLDMYRYRVGEGDTSRAERLYRALVDSHIPLAQQSLVT